MKIDGEQAYPIYHFTAHFAQDGEHDPKCPVWHEDLPEGRIWNRVSAYRMFREPPRTSELDDKVREWWAANRDATRPSGSIAEKHPADVVLTAVLERHETWCGTWFSHWTFDTGQSDEEALASFQRFVDRMRPLDSDHGGEYCLMGAEDRWRWCGTEDGSPESKTEPPCRCTHCKEQGVIRIGH